MIKQWWQRISMSLTGAAVIIGCASILSRGLGLLRDNLLVKYITTAQLDIYTAAFKIPDLIFNVVVLGALSASFIPIFIEVRQKHQLSGAFAMANSILNILLLLVTIGMMIGFVIAPEIAQVFMRRYPEKQTLTVTLLRIMLCSIWFFTISNVMAGMLNALRRFVAYALAPMLYNLGIIFGVIVLYPKFGLVGLAYGVVSGAALHCLIQVVAAWRIGWRYRFISNLRDFGVQKIFQLMPPRALALSMMQLSSFIMAIFVAGFAEGSLTNWTYADNLQNVPINVIGVSLALSAFPVFSQAFVENDLAKFKTVFSKNIRRILFLIIPVSIVLLLLRAQLVRLLFASLGSTLFSWQDTITTAQILGIFSLSLFAQAISPMVARSFFAHQDTKTPVIISAIRLVMNTVLAWVLSRYLGIYGLAAAFALSSILEMLTLFVILRLRYGDLDDQRVIQATLRIVLASSLMAVVMHGMKYFIAPLVDMHTVIGVCIQTVLSLMAGAIIYISIALYYQFDEVQLIKVYLRKVVQLFHA